MLRMLYYLVEYELTFFARYMAQKIARLGKMQERTFNMVQEIVRSYPNSDVVYVD